MPTRKTNQQHTHRKYVCAYYCLWRQKRTPSHMLLLYMCTEEDPKCIWSRNNIPKSFEHTMTINIQHVASSSPHACNMPHQQVQIYSWSVHITHKLYTHTHVDTSTKAANNTDALTAPATPPLHPKALSPLHRHAASLLPFPKTRNEAFQASQICFFDKEVWDSHKGQGKSKINQNMLDTGECFWTLEENIYIYYFG